MALSPVTALRLRAVLLIVVAASLAVAVVLIAPPPAPPPAQRGPGELTIVGDPPRAHQEALPSGRPIQVLFAANGRLYYGYGDYSGNAGSTPVADGIDVAFLDLVSGGFGVAYASFHTEAITTFRGIGGHVYVPNVDPSTGSVPNESLVTDASGAWGMPAGGVPAVHVFDVATTNGADLIAVGAAGEAADNSDSRAVAWRSVDGGASWSEVASDTTADPSARTGFERYYWAGSLGGAVYVQADLGGGGSPPPLRRFDGKSWSEVGVEQPFCAGDNGSLLRRGADVVTVGSRLFCVAEGSVDWFDGTQTGQVAGLDGATVLSVGDDGALYALTRRCDLATVVRIDESLAVTPVWQATSPEVVLEPGNLAVVGTGAFATVAAADESGAAFSQLAWLGFGPIGQEC